MIHPAKDFFNYFKECYKLDYKEFEVDNILGSKHLYKWFVSAKEELLSGEYPIVPYMNKKVESLEKEITLYQLEKKLFYGCFFLLGRRSNSFAKDKRLCAPLLLFPAEIETRDGEKFLRIDKQNPTINRSVIGKLQLKSKEQSTDNFIRDLHELLYSQNSDWIRLHSLMESYFLNVDCEDLVLYPQVWSVHKLRKHFSSTEYPEGQFRMIPAAGTVFVEKSESSLRVINDLGALAEQGDYNRVLSNLLGNRKNYSSPSGAIFESRLNKDQFKALENSNYYTNSVIVGPPGTGKSYTITSIVCDAILNDKSVLVVSKTKQAVEVLRRMLEDDFRLKPYLVHTTGHSYRYSLKSKLSRHLNGIVGRSHLTPREEGIYNLHAKLENLEERFEKFVERELKISDLSFSNDINLWEKWRKFYLKSKSFNADELWYFLEAIESALEELEIQIAHYIKRKLEVRLRDNLREYRKDLALFLDAIEANGFSEYKRIVEGVNHKNILKVFPVWLANLSDLNSVLPLQKDLFDLVIIDEATQCDIASALPALYRAKGAIVVGDPNQLRHYSFVAQKQQQLLRNKLGLSSDKILDYRNRSILDVFISKIEDQDQLTFLREHFRSTPSLIEFSNRHFYEGQLEVLKATPKHRMENQLEIVEVQGSRDVSGINRTEAKAVVRKLKTIVDAHKGEKDPPSLGVLSLFTKQVEHLRKEIREVFELDVINRFKLSIGTPYSFQGSEREIMLISFALCDNSHPSAFIHANKTEVLNVAITRAKSYQILFKSVSKSKLNKESLLYQYFDFAENFKHRPEDEQEQDAFQKDVYQELQRLEVDTVEYSYPLAGSILDLFVVHQGVHYFIDLIGYPGMFKEAFSIERYKTLARVGIKSFPLHYTLWQKDRQGAIDMLRQKIL